MIRLRLRTRQKSSPAEEAARWLVREDGQSLAREEEAELAEWLAAERNDEAMSRLEAKLALFDLPVSHFPELDALREEAYSLPESREWWRRPAASGVLLAASVSVIMILTLIGKDIGSFVSRSRAPGPEVAAAVSASPGISEQAIRAGQAGASTKVGERRVLILADGTRLTMNTGTRVAIEYGARRRLVRLLGGQALFEVTHDPQRPFTVVAGGRAVTALGTVFEVRVRPGKIDVMLVTGRVAVASATEKSSAARGGPDRPVILSPGQALSAASGLKDKISDVDVESRLLWRQGLVEFNNVSLAEAVSEINRYSAQPIVVTNQEVGSMRIGGVYETGDPAHFVAAIEKMLPVDVKRTPEGSLELSERP